MRIDPRYTKFLKLFIGLLVLSQIEVACGDSGGIAPTKQAVSPTSTYNERAAAEPAADALGGIAAPAETRRVITKHGMSVEVDELAPAFEVAVSLAEQSGGYTTSTNRYRAPDGSMHGNVSMRVPPAGAEGVLAGLRKLGSVTSESSSGEDITGQYVDLEARLINARASEERLHEMMQRRSASLSDVLAVERELTRVRGDIESMEARKRTWDTLTDLVAISVDLNEPPGAMPAARNIWHPIKTALGEAAEALAQSVHYAIVFAAAVLPWLVVFGLLGWAAYKVARRRKKTTG